MSDTQTDAAGRTTHTVTDSDGRVLEIKGVNMLEEFDLIEIAGAENSANARWMQYATICACVRTINDLPSTALMGKKSTLRNWVGRVGPAGYAAVVKALDLLVKNEDDEGSDPQKAQVEQVKNSAGTPISAN